MRSIAASRFEICACKEARRSLMRPASARTWRASLPRRASARFAFEIARSESRSESRASRVAASFFSSSRLTASMRPRSALRFSS
jgi:hypothetical protein